MIEAHAYTKNGELIFQSKIGSLLRNLEGKELLVTIKKRVKKRSKEQNDYYWAMLRRISSETGQDVNSVHDFCRDKFLPKVRMVIGGKEFWTIGHTPDQSKPEFWDYCENIRMFFLTEFCINLEDSFME